MPGQVVTVPSVLDGVEGGSASNVPFGSSLACRYQCIYNANTLPWTGPRLITGIKIRADNGSPLAPGNAIAGKGYLVVSVMLSTTSATALSASSTFDDNRGVDRQWVLQGHHLQLPAQAVTTITGPRPADIDLMFTTPFWYGLTPVVPNQAMPENLLVEIQILSQPSGAYPVDNAGGCIAPKTQFGNQGLACHAVGLAPPTLSSSPSMIAGSNFSWNVANCEPNVPFVLAFNLTDQGAFLGQPQYPLPYALFDPLNPSLPPPALASVGWSAPDCWSNIQDAVTLFATADANGLASLNTPLPSGSQFVGLEMFAQALIYSQTANPLQIITTHGHSSTVCGPIDIARVFAFYNGTGTPTPPPPTSGAVQYGAGLVIEVL